VDYVEVTARHEATRIRGLPALDGRARRAFELRWIDARMHGADTMELTRGAAELLGARSCAREIAAILRSGAEVSEPGASGTQPNWRTIGAGDVAVLVRTHWQGALVRKELAQLHIAAVSSARGSVLKSTALPWLCTFLDALAEPGRDRIARALAVTPLFGWTALDLALALDQGRTAGGGAVEPDPRWARWIEAILGWARRYASSGFIRAFESALDAHDVLRRLLALAEGERHATDLRHLAELCHAEERRTRVGPGALATWLRKAADIATADEDKALRLESDALAVQITTVHTAKGLEYPIVMLPFGWYERGFEDDGNPIAWHERPKHAAAWIPRLDFHAANTDDRARAFDVARIEDGQERLRLTYVALTRARHHCVAWLGPITDRGRPRRGALWQLMLRERDASGRVAPDAPAPADDAAFGAREDLLAQLAQIAASSGGAVGFAVAPPQVETVPRVADPVSRDEIRALAWTGPSSLGSRFQVTSYSTLVAGRTADLEEPHRKDVVLANLALGDAAGEGLEQSPDGDNTGAAVDLNEPSADETLSGTHLAAPAPLAPMLGGKEIGTWVHAVFEHLDFPSGTSTEGEPAVLLAAALGERQGIRAGTQHALLANALPAILETPLDGAQTLLPPGFCLRQLARGDRLDELHFDLRLGAGSQYRRSKQPGDAPRNVHGCIDEGAARRALEARLDAEPGWRGAHWLQTLLERTDPREGTRKPVLPAIAGILTGAIDLIFRVGAAPESARYYVADYKTNRITSHESRRDSLLLHYTQPWLHTEMARHGYPLQALLYTIGLHRMLRQRLAGAYDYDRHMGGCLYLFLRGMQGAQCHRDGGLALGVLHERWPRHVVLGLDAALCGESPEAVSRILDAPRPEGAAR
jgi:exodeoxyribonuclease V beta subunit